MATTYKLLGNDDVASTKTLLYESIPVTGSLVSSSVYLGSNIKTYTSTHGLFQTVYDYPVLSSSANQLFSITLGRSSDTTSTNQDSKKKLVYNQMSKVLLNLDASNELVKFDNDGAGAAGVDLHNLYFLNFSRLLVKDEIKKGSFSIELGAGARTAEFAGTVTLSDTSGSSNYFESATGEYGLLYLSSSYTGVAASGKDSVQGLIFYQAGIVALSPYIWAASGSAAPTAANSTFNTNNLGALTSLINFSGSSKVGDAFVSGTVNDSCDILRTRIKNIQFNNTTELNSTIYFCRLNNSEFNYSSNPTYLDGSEIRVKNGNALNAPVTYFTTVGLYSPDNQLLAVAKVSEPLRKSPTEELILRVRLDY